MEFFRQEYWSGLPGPSPGSFPDSGITPRSPALKADSLPSEWPAVKKAEHWKIDAFELWFWRRLLRVLWTARRSNQSLLKEINPEYSLEGLMLKLKLQYFGHLMQRASSLEKTLILGKIEGRRRRGRQKEKVTQHHWFNEHEFEQTAGDTAGQGSLACCSPWGHKELHATWQTEQKHQC